MRRLVMSFLIGLDVMLLGYSGLFLSFCMKYLNGMAWQKLDSATFVEKVQDSLSQGNKKT